MRYFLTFIFLIFILISCEKEPEIPTGQGNKIELSVSTDYVLRIDTAATAKGIINNLGYMGEVIQHGHCWSVTPQPDTSYYRTKLGYKNSKGEFYSNLGNLDLNTNYYVRAYIANATHVAYGEQKIIRAVCGGLTNITYDAQTYNIIPLGNQCWMSRNLNVGMMVPSTTTNYHHSNVTNNGTIEKYCYNNELDSCDVNGGLYDWNEMMAYTQTEGTKGICPDGWHIPSNYEWEKLVTYFGGNYNAGIQLKGSTSNQFNALLKGYRLSNGTFVENNIGTRFWTSTTNYEDLAFYRYLTDSYDGVMNKTYKKDGAFHVRCLKND